MFKFITLSCLLAVSVQCKISQNQAVPYYPQPYPAVYPQVYPQVYSAQPKYSVQPAYVAAASYPTPGSYRQVFVPASPAYNPYYYGYAPYPAYSQAQQYPYAYVQNDGTQPAGAQPGWGEYLSNSFWSYVPNFPYVTSGAQSPTEAESGASTATAAATSESSAENTNSGKGDKPAEGSKTEQPASDEQPSQSPSKQFAAYPLPYFAQPQFYGQAPYQQAVYDPVKLNAANNGAVSSFLFPRSQLQSVFQQPQPFADQKYYQVPQSNQGTAAQAYQKYLQSQKQNFQGQYQLGQFQYQQQDQPFQQQAKSFQQQYEQQPQKDESSVVVDSNVTGLQVNSEGQQQPQSKVATGSN